MKKILFMLFVFMFLCFPIITKALVTNSFYNSINIYFFSENNCKDCDKEKNWLEKEFKNDNRVKIEYIKIEDNKKLNTKIRKSLNIKKNNEPLIIIGSNYFISFSSDIKNNIKEAIDSYEDADEFCDIVSMVKNNKDVKECIKQNEKIYKQPIEFPVYIKVIITISIIGLIIGIGLFILKKKYKLFD